MLTPLTVVIRSSGKGVKYSFGMYLLLSAPMAMLLIHLGMFPFL
jgi:hypothetical protein